MATEHTPSSEDLEIPIFTGLEMGRDPDSARAFTEKTRENDDEILAQTERDIRDLERDQAIIRSQRIQTLGRISRTRYRSQY